MHRFTRSIIVSTLLASISGCSAETGSPPQREASLADQDLALLRDLGVSSVDQSGSEYRLLDSDGQLIGSVTRDPNGTVHGDLSGHTALFRSDETSMTVGCDGREIEFARSETGEWAAQSPAPQDDLSSCSSALEVCRVIAGNAVDSVTADAPALGEQSYCTTTSSYVFNVYKDSCGACQQVVGGCAAVNGWSCNFSCNIGSFTTSCSQTACWDGFALEAESGTES